MKTIIESQFNDCPLIWMCHSRELNHKINRLHERSLRLVYKNSNLNFQQLLEKDKSFTIHERNLQKLVVVMYKVIHNLCPKPVQDLFICKTRGSNEFVLPKANTINRGIETIRFMGPKIWNVVPEEIKKTKTISAFKEKIKNWKTVGCPCRICKSYVSRLGYGTFQGNTFR